MASKARVTALSLDGADSKFVLELARQGEMPAFARLLDEAAVIETLAPMGVFVGAIWPTIATANEPDRHRFVCWEEYRGGTYDYRETDPTMMRGTPIWERLSDAGRRVAVLDVPHAIARPVNGAAVVEWGCHDRHFGPRSWPPELISELAERHGRHFGAMAPPGRDQFAPCDYAHRAAGERSDEESLALFEDICAGIENKRRVSLDLLDRGGWDLFLSVMGESHCAGHQLWHLHDPEHERHDAALARRLGGDPVREVYRRLDGVVGEHLARVGPDGTAYVLLAHGMTAHHDGTHLLDHLLNRLDWSLDAPNGFAAGTRAAATVTRWIPRPVRARTLRLTAPIVRARTRAEHPGPVPPLPERRWFLTPNNTVVGAVRLNLAGREPAGRIHPDDRRAALRWLSERLEELVNVDTGGRVVRRCVVADDVYRRSPDDALGDLYVEWERDAPIERVWSPAIGTVVVPYDHWRQGDHVREGILLAKGPGIRPGRRRGVRRICDVGATLCAALDLPLPDVDGEPIASVLPGGRASAARRDRRARARVPRWARPGASLDHVRDAAAARAEAAAAQEEVAALHGRVEALERLAEVATMTAWLPFAEVPEELLISVVMPTRDRCELLARAVASVEQQSYGRWELIVVDDGSTDGTAAYLSAIADPRVRALSRDGVGECGARNAALDAATGDVIVYLDDDNRFDPQWLKAVAAAFTTHVEMHVGYGARICDDEGRVALKRASGRPWLQFAPWSEQALRDFNIADTNVITHRRGEIRFDDELSYAGDWDLLLRLTAESQPVEIPAIAAYYRTDQARVSTALSAEEIDRQLHAIRVKHAIAPRA